MIPEAITRAMFAVALAHIESNGIAFYQGTLDTKRMGSDEFRSALSGADVAGAIFALPVIPAEHKGYETIVGWRFDYVWH